MLIDPLVRHQPTSNMVDRNESMNKNKENLFINQKNPIEFHTFRGSITAIEFDGRFIARK